MPTYSMLACYDCQPRVQLDVTCPCTLPSIGCLAYMQVASGVHTLNPCFARSRHQFRNVGLRSTLRVLVYDRRSALDSRLLGVARLPAASIPAGSGPLYMWLPLSPPPRKGQNKLARLQVNPGRHSPPSSSDVHAL